MDIASLMFPRLPFALVGLTMASLFLSGCESTDETTSGVESVIIPSDAARHDIAMDDPWATAGIPEGPLGGDRPAELVLPSDYDPTREWPLVVLLHGYGVTAWIQDIYLNLSAQADDLGAVILLPDGNVNAAGMPYWNATDACCDFEDSGVDDVGYLLDLIAEARTVLHVDPGRILLVGHSNGGYMAHQMACSAADVITGIVSLAAPMPLKPEDCQPSRPVSVVEAHGTLDATVLYWGVPLSYPSAEETFERWAVHNGCAGEPVVTGPTDYDDGVAGAETTVSTYASCVEGAGVQFLSMEGTGHIPLFDKRFSHDTVGFLLDRPRGAVPVQDSRP